jgi:hypothetical protein
MNTQPNQPGDLKSNAAESANSKGTAKARPPQSRGSAGQDAINSLRAAPEHRLEELRKQRQQEAEATMFNPLGESEQANLRVPPYSFRERIEHMISRDPRKAIFRQMLHAINPNTAPESHAPVVHLALVGTSLQNFVNVLLPWARQASADASADQNQVEAKVWGVSLPHREEVRGFIQAYAYLGGGDPGLAKLNTPAERAIVQKNGAIALEVALHKAMKPLRALNPHQVWAEAKTSDVGAQEAGRVYLSAASSVVPFVYHRMVEDLAAIAWNRDLIAPRDGRVAAPALTPRELAYAVLRSAVLNHTNAETLAQVRKQISLCVAPRSSAGEVKQALNTITSSLPIESLATHRRFIKYVVMNAPKAHTGSQLLHEAWRQVSRDFSPTALCDLLSVESSILRVIQPTESVYRGGRGVVAHQVLTSAFGEYTRALRSSIPWQVITQEGKFAFSQSIGTEPRVLDKAAIAELLPLSALLAGVPLVERNRMFSVFC